MEDEEVGSLHFDLHPNVHHSPVHFFKALGYSPMETLCEPHI